jgi:predicted DNA-binding transcriptional regulator AlpA
MEGFLTSDELAAHLGIQRSSVHRYRTRGDIPEPDQYVGRTPLWAVASVDAWLKDRPGHGWRKGKKRQSSSEPPQPA